MANILSDAKKQQVIALGQLGWTLRRIEAATGVRRETAGAYLKAAGIAVRPPGAHPVIVTAPGEEGQVDYGDGPMVRHSVTRKYRRTAVAVGDLGEAGEVGEARRDHRCQDPTRWWYWPPGSLSPGTTASARARIDWNLSRIYPRHARPAMDPVDSASVSATGPSRASAAAARGGRRTSCGTPTTSASIRSSCFSAARRPLRDSVSDSR